MSKLARIPAAARADAPAGKVARQVTRQRVQAAVYYWQRVAKRDVPRADDIHQLRVWSRRTMAAVQLFAPLLASEPAQAVQRILNKARKRAGKIRDCDVLLKTLDKSARAALAEPLALLQDQRQAAAKKLKRAYRKQVRAGKLKKWTTALLQHPSHSGVNGHAASPIAFGTWFLHQFALVAKDFLQQLRTAKPTPRRIHPLRIEGKRIRYALEIGLPSLPKKAAKELYAALEQLQEQLGAICDDEALAERYHELAADLNGKQQLRLNKLAARHEQQARAGFVEFTCWWRATNGRKELLRRFAAILHSPIASPLRKRSSRPQAQRRKSQEK